MSGGGQRPQVTLGLIGDFEARAWIELFRDCHEWHWDGALVQARHNKKKNVRTGFYSRHCWPERGGYADQPNLIIEVFRVLKDEENRMQAENF
jgi:hypothetical protein